MIKTYDKYFIRLFCKKLLLVFLVFFSLTFISPNDLVNFSNLCENGDFSSSINKKCENIILIYWLLLASFFFFFAFNNYSLSIFQNE